MTEDEAKDRKDGLTPLHPKRGLCLGCRITRDDFDNPNAVCNHEGSYPRQDDCGLKG